MNDEKRGPGRPPKSMSLVAPVVNIVPEAKPEAKKDEPATKQVRLLRNYKPEGGEKHKAGELLDLPLAEARHVVKNGVAERADEF